MALSADYISDIGKPVLSSKSFMVVGQPGPCNPYYFLAWPTVRKSVQKAPKAIPSRTGKPKTLHSDWG